MTQQLVLSINANADKLHWCWLEQGLPVQEQHGDWQSFHVALTERSGQEHPQAWLLIPGAKLGVREMAYTEKEKRHLRNLLPYQLEETVVGDVDDLHIALGEPQKGKVSLAFIDRSWLKSIFDQCKTLGVEITRCWAKPLVLPLVNTDRFEPALLDELTESASAQTITKESASKELNKESQKNAEEETVQSVIVSALPVWTIAIEQQQAQVRYADQNGFAVPVAFLVSALDKLREQLQWKDRMPQLLLRAETDSELAQLRTALAAYAPGVIEEQVASRWVLDFNGQAINLCQAEFSQRLPLERWWKLWQSIIVFALVTLVIYVGVAAFHIYKLKKQNLVLRQQMEQIYRDVIPHGNSDDPEKRLRIKVSELQPKTTTGSLMALVGGVFPTVAGNSDVVIKVISYASESGELTINVQAHSFAAIDALRQNLASQGFNAELMNANAQGDLNSGRLKISKP